jgi:hypothetical protein
MAAKLDIEIYSLVINKECTEPKLKENLPVLYSYLIKILLEKLILPNHKMFICLDKCMSATQRDNFENYITTEFFSKFHDMPNLEISHENSGGNEALQVTDFVCGAFGYKYNTAKLKDDCEHYTVIIKDKIKEERNDFFKKR